MNPFVILLGGRDALLARETLVTCIHIYIYNLYRCIHFVLCCRCVLQDHWGSKEVPEKELDTTMAGYVISIQLNNKPHSSTVKLRCRFTSLSHTGQSY